MNWKASGLGTMMMSNSEKARRAIVTIGPLEVEGFQLPDGSYRMSQTQAAEVVGLTERNARDFLNSKALKSLLGEDYTPAKLVEIEAEGEQLRGQSRIRPLPLEVVSAYWLWQSHRGNKQALSLCVALVTESLERRFDAAFGVSRTEAERDDLLTNRIQTLERDLSQLGDTYALDDTIRAENQELQRQLKAHGIEPFRDWPTEEKT